MPVGPPPTTICRIRQSRNLVRRSLKTDHVKQTINFFLALSGERSSLHAYQLSKNFRINPYPPYPTKKRKLRTVHKLSLHPLRIGQFLHEARMFFHTRDPKRLCLSADCIDEVVIGNCG